MTAKPIKLRNGNWGAKVAGKVSSGDTITIRTRSGKSWDTVVDRVLFTGDGVSIVTTMGRDRYIPARRDSRGMVVERGHYEGYCGYPCPVTGKRCCPENGPCHDCM